MKNLTFGIEIELTGLSRVKATKMVAEHFRLPAVMAVVGRLLIAHQGLKRSRGNLKDQGVEVSPTWRGMGAADSNVDRFILRTAKRGRSWSKRGLEAILHMLGLLYENILHDSIKQLDVLLDAPDTKEFIATSAGQIAKTVGRKAIGARQAGFPALGKGTQGFAKLFRDVCMSKMLVVSCIGV